MASINFDSIWNLIQEYKFEYESPDDFNCVICKKLMNDAFQSHCGCQYCCNCIRDYIGNGTRYCPGNSQYCNDEHLSLESNVFRNALLNRKIVSLKVICPNKSCGSKIQLIDIGEHLRVCTKQPIECPYIAIGCLSDQSNKDSIRLHLDEYLLSHTQLFVELIQNMGNDINILTNELARITQENLSLKEELRNEIQTKVMGVTNDLQRITMQQSREIESLKSKITEVSEVNKLEIMSLKEEILNGQNIIVVLDEELKEIRGKVEAKATTNADGENIVMNKRINNLVKSFPNIDADFLWKIDDCSKKINEGIFSEPFYSDNYKLCLRLCIYGGDIGFWCIVMRGDNDDIMEWPMKRAVTLSIIDQQTLKTYKSETYKFDKCDRNISAFDRPTSAQNGNGIGSVSFAKYFSAKSKATIMVDDSLLVVCNVTIC